MLVVVSHEACEERAEALREVLYTTQDRLREVTKDRDEWKQQHENLLAIYRAQTEELAALRRALPQPAESK
jgi:hypothetical protein